MLWAKNNKNYSVSFTEDAADEQLLQAIEKELNGHKYQTFSNLCKQALWQFLSLSDSAQSLQSFQRLEQRVIEINKQLQDLKQELSTEKHNLKKQQELENQLTKLSNLLTQLQVNVNVKFVETLEAIKNEFGKVDELGNTAKVAEVKPTTPKPARSEKSEAEKMAELAQKDPMLARLKSILPDDF
ncbi:MAG: hypothetical protein F6K35_36725 [Okeania sp. SIO2H7]|nr:hypothetical protein [Okeania sp. SIO2H7]